MRLTKRNRCYWGEHCHPEYNCQCCDDFTPFDLDELNDDYIGELIENERENFREYWQEYMAEMQEDIFF